MALSGSFGSNFGGGYRVQVDWSATQDKVNNKSTITLNFYLISLGSGYTIVSSSSKTGFTKIGSTVENYTATASLSGNQKKLLNTQVQTVTHDSDGTLDVALQGSFDIAVTLADGYHDTVSTSSLVTLDTIPRASTLTSGQNWTAGNPTTFNISRADTSFTHDIQVEVYNGTSWYNFGTVATGVATSYKWTPTDAQMTSLFDFLNNDTTSFDQQSRITITTKSGGSVIGTSQVTGTVSSPAASTVTPPSSFNVGDSFVVPITRALSSLVHTIKLKNGSTIYKTFTLVGTTVTIDTAQMSDDGVTTIKDRIFTDTPNVQSIALTIECTTIFDSQTTDQQVRTPTTKTITANIVNSNPIFTTASYADIDPTVPTVTKNNQYIVQKKSSVRVTILNANKAFAQNAASIVKYIATIGAISKSVNSPFATDITIDLGVIDATTDQNLVVSAYDSRGFKTDVTLTVKMVPYSPPVVQAQALRDSGFLDNTVLSLTGTISPLNVNGTNMNSLVTADVKYRYRVVNGTWSAYFQFLGQTLTMPIYNATSVNLTLTNTSAWEVEVTVTDKLGNTVTTPPLQVPVGTPIAFFDALLKSVGIGMFPNGTGTFETAGDMVEAGTKLMDKYAPAGIVQMFAGASPPSGWLMCDGSAISRTAYSRLFAIIGTTYGVGDGSTTFNLPNLKGKVPVGYNTAETEFNTLGKTGGEKTHVLTTAEMPSHKHSYAMTGQLSTTTYPSGTTKVSLNGATTSNAYTGGGESTGGDTAHNNLQPYIALNFMIKI